MLRPQLVCKITKQTGWMMRFHFEWAAVNIFYEKHDGTLSEIKTYTIIQFEYGWRWPHEYCKSNVVFFFLIFHSLAYLLHVYSILLGSRNGPRTCSSFFLFLFFFTTIMHLISNIYCRFCCWTYHSYSVKCEFYVWHRISMAHCSFEMF